MIEIINANALRIPLASESVQCVITSPPYFGLRDYGTAKWEGGSVECDHKSKVMHGTLGSTLRNDGRKNPGMQETDKTANQAMNHRVTCPKCGAIRVDAQIGLERTPTEYVDNLVSVFREVWRVLKDDGVLFLNPGDSYWGNYVAESRVNGRPDTLNPNHAQKKRDTRKPLGLIKPKDLLGIPWRVAFALQADGWYLRSDIIWHKPNPMPESVKGSHYSRHRVTIEEYERLSRLRKEQGKDKIRPGNVPSVQTRKVFVSQAALPKEREGSINIPDQGATPGRKEKKAGSKQVASSPSQQSTLRENGKGKDHKGESLGEISDNGQGEGISTRLLSENKKHPDAPGTKATGQRTLQPDGKVQEQEAQGLRQTERGDSSGPDSDGGGLARDSQSTQAPLLLLRQAKSVDAGSRYPGEQGRATRQGEYSSGLSELQLEEEGQIDSPDLVDCPGCTQCEGDNGYIFHLSAGRPTKAHEYIFLLTKSERYFYDAEAIAEPLMESSIKRNQSGWNGNEQRGYVNGPQNHMSKYLGSDAAKEETHRNRRTVWTIATSPYSGAHFATFPPKLVEPMILAGSAKGDLVLDPFAGTATVGRVAIEHRRRFVGIELNPAYIKLALDRTSNVGVRML